MSSVKVRDSANRAISRCLKASVGADLEGEVERVETYLKVLEEQWERFNKAQDEVEGLCGAEALAVEEAVRIQTETWYVEALTNFKKLLRRSNSLSRERSTTSVRLPQMELPNFSGTPTEWLSFRDVFVSLVHSNPDLADNQKLHYLRSCLKGEALRLIEAFGISDANYKEAWEILQDRYQVLRVIVDRHLSAMTYIQKAADDSASAIKAVIDTVTLHTHALKALNRPVQFWDDWLIYLVVTKLSFDTRKQWELSCESNDELPSFEDLRQFLQNRCRSLEVMAQSKPQQGKPRGVLHASKEEEAQVNAATKSTTFQGCLSCEGAHKSYACEKFNSLPIPSRLALVKEKGACFNCLSRGHTVISCRSQSNCRICNGRHHTALHNQDVSTTVDEGEHTTAVNHSVASKQILLATAQIKVKDQKGRWQLIRALFDNGSHISLITEACAMRLGLKERTSNIIITGVGGTASAKTRGQVSLSVSPRQSEEVTMIDAYILPKITSNLPAKSIKVESWNHYADLDLADPDFLRSAPVDVLIGMDVMDQFLLPGMRKGPPGSPIAQLTTFGWVLAGRIEGASHCLMNNLCTSDAEITDALVKLWEMDQFPKKRFLSAEEAACEKHFIETHSRTPEGRFIVKLPFKENAQQLIGETKERATRNFLRLERQTEQNDDLREHYTNFMEELLQLGHMELAKDVPKGAYYMPHHAVIKNSSTTTKLRVVFNASSKSSSGYSLNDALMVGPQLQQDLFSILIRFRSYQFAMSADIEKMYRQVHIDTEHLDFQRIFWRSNPSEELQAYRLTRVTYGVASASYLAVRAMQQVASEHREERAEAAEAIFRDFYMDDLLTGATSEDKLLELQRSISDILSIGGFPLRKWSSNSRLLAETLSLEPKQLAHYTVDADEVRTLGLTWNTKYDEMTYVVDLGQCPTKFTKRTFLADASLLFDPIGLLVPCTIKARLWFQELWSEDVDWDDLVPECIAKQWVVHRQDLSKLSRLKLSRWIGFDEIRTAIELHVFADASEKAYAAAIYARTILGNEVSVTLVAARAKVAPKKTITLPRLELCAAHLASKLFHQVSNSLTSWSFQVFAWTDSTITLAWLQDYPGRWSTFIANRVAAIQEILPPSTWAHVNSEQNPADCASRGVSVEFLLQHDMWWNGPKFLREHAEEWPHNPAKIYSTTLEMKNRELTTHLATIEDTWSLITKYSSYNKLRRIVVYVSRFVHNVRLSIAKRKGASTGFMVYADARKDKRNGFITSVEFRNAEMLIIRYTQQLHFSNELSCFRENKPIPLRSNLHRLRPFVDEAGILRVGGRLQNLAAKFDSKHPIILPKNSAIVRLIISDLHLNSLHGGPQIVQTLLSRRYWIPGVRNLVRKLYRNCVKCTILNRRPMQQMMSNLPEYRLSYVRCFLCTAVDYAGPFSVKFSAGRGAKVTKGYVSTFICMSTGAMHLELASDLTTAAFLNAFKRFISRRGICRDIHSDNGTNFAGASKELEHMFQTEMNNRDISNYFAEYNITWHFNPPNAPHMGGYWETGVKRMKYFLKRTLGDNLLTFEEFSTLLTEIEACINSRPLCVYAADSADCEVLTPGHFIIGEALKSIPDPDDASHRSNLTQRWELLVTMKRYFWKRWRNEYIVSLQKRVKWFREAPNLKENDIVIVLGERTPPMKWKLGRVIRCVPGTDGLVRVASIRTADGDLLRPISKLCILPTKDDMFSV